VFFSWQGKKTLGDKMDCSWVRQHVECILDDEYPPKIADQLTEHLLACRDCAEILRTAEKEERLLRSAQPRIGVPRDLVPGIMASLPEVGCRERNASRSAHSLRVILPLAGAAAAIVVAFVLRFRVGGEEKGGELSRTARPETESRYSHQDHAQHEVSVVATLRACRGNVTLVSKRDGPRQAAPGIGLRIDTTLSTTADSTAELDFGGKVRVRLDSDSRARLTSPSGVLLASGRLFVWVEEKGTRFAVTTPQVEAEVRGTEFCVDSRTEGRTVLTVVEGVVVFSNEHGTVEVEAGWQSHTETGSGLMVARPVDVSAIVAWTEAGETDPAPGIDVRLRARLDPKGSPLMPVPGGLAAIVELDYGDSACVPLWVSCEITGGGRTAAEQSVQTSTSSHRYHVKRMRFPELGPGKYRAHFRVSERQEGSAETLDFEVR